MRESVMAASRSSLITRHRLMTFIVAGSFAISVACGGNGDENSGEGADGSRTTAQDDGSGSAAGSENDSSNGGPDLPRSLHYENLEWVVEAVEPRSGGENVTIEGPHLAVDVSVRNQTDDVSYTVPAGLFALVAPDGAVRRAEGIDQGSDSTFEVSRGATTTVTLLVPNPDGLEPKQLSAQVAESGRVPASVPLSGPVPASDLRRATVTGEPDQPAKGVGGSAIVNATEATFSLEHPEDGDRAAEGTSFLAIDAMVEGVDLWVMLHHDGHGLVPRLELDDGQKLAGDSNMLRVDVGERASDLFIFEVPNDRVPVAFELGSSESGFARFGVEVEER